MKKGTLWLIALMIGLAVNDSHAREFKSADGEKTVDAEFVRYNPRTKEVTLKMATGRNLVTKSSFFSDADVAYFKEQHEKEQLDGAISVRAHDKISRESMERDRLLIQKTNADFTFTFKNESDVDLQNLNMKYWVVVERDQKGKEFNETSNGSADVVELKADGEQEIIGPRIVLTTGAVPKATGDEKQYKKLLNEAAKFGRDRILGWRVELYDLEGELVMSDSSSLRVDRILGVAEEDR